MLSDKELRRNGNYWAMKAKAFLTEVREDQPEELIKAYWRLLKWKYEISCWNVAATEAHLQALRAGRGRGNDLRDAEENLVEAKELVYEPLKQGWRKYRAKQRKKRTCSHCGTTAPFSSRAFPYCGGCRHSDVARKDRPRYCSEECQRAHWLAGHMSECPCAG